MFDSNGKRSSENASSSISDDLLKFGIIYISGQSDWVILLGRQWKMAEVIDKIGITRKPVQKRTDSHGWV